MQALINRQKSNTSTQNFYSQHAVHTALNLIYSPSSKILLWQVAAGLRSVELLETG